MKREEESMKRRNETSGRRVGKQDWVDGARKRDHVLDEDRGTNSNGRKPRRMEEYSYSLTYYVCRWYFRSRKKIVLIGVSRIDIAWQSRTVSLFLRNRCCIAIRKESRECPDCVQNRRLLSSSSFLLFILSLFPDYITLSLSFPHASSFFSFPTSSSLLSSFLHRLSLLSHFYSSLSRSRYLNCPSAEIFSRIANLWTSPSMDRANDVLVYLYRYVRPRTGTNSTRERETRTKERELMKKI